MVSRSQGSSPRDNWEDPPVYPFDEYLTGASKFSAGSPGRSIHGRNKPQGGFDEQGRYAKPPAQKATEDAVVGASDPAAAAAVGEAEAAEAAAAAQAAAAAAVARGSPDGRPCTPENGRPHRCSRGQARTSNKSRRQSQRSRSLVWLGTSRCTRSDPPTLHSCRFLTSRWSSDRCGRSNAWQEPRAVVAARATAAEARGAASATPTAAEVKARAVAARAKVAVAKATVAAGWATAAAAHRHTVAARTWAHKASR